MNAIIRKKILFYKKYIYKIYKYRKIKKKQCSSKFSLNIEIKKYLFFDKLWIWIQIHFFKNKKYYKWIKNIVIFKFVRNFAAQKTDISIIIQLYKKEKKWYSD